jgi:hypothetical protein
MNDNNSLGRIDAIGWRYCYECTAPNGSRLQTANESEAFFWHLLGYEVVRLVERVPMG